MFFPEESPAQGRGTLPDASRRDCVKYSRASFRRGVMIVPKVMADHTYRSVLGAESLQPHDQRQRLFVSGVAV